MAGDPINDVLVAITQRRGGAREGRWPLMRFVREAWKLIRPEEEFQGNWYHEELCLWCEALIDGDMPEQVICGPSRSGKSTIISKMLHPWAWTFAPSLQFLTASHAHDLAEEDASHARMIIESEWYQDRWPLVFRPDQNVKSFYANTRGGHRQIASPGGKTTGKGGHIIIGDDLLDAEDRHSPTKVRRASAYWRETLGSRGNGPNPRRLLTGQRLSLVDPPATVMGIGRYSHLVRSQEYDQKIQDEVPKGREPTVPCMDPRTQDGELMWPERLNREAIETLKEGLGPFAWGAMHQQSPVPESGGVINETDFREWSMPGGQANPTPAEILRHFVPDVVQIHVDGRFKKDANTGSFVIAAVLARKGNDAYFFGLFRKRVGLFDTLRALEPMVREWSPSRVVVERKASGESIIEAFEEALTPEFGNIVEGHNPVDSKRARLEARSDILKTGRFYIPTPRTFLWAEVVKSETVAFPDGTHDDIPDMISQGLTYLFPSHRTRNWYAEALKNL